MGTGFGEWVRIARSNTPKSRKEYYRACWFTETNEWLMQALIVWVSGAAGLFLMLPYARSNWAVCLFQLVIGILIVKALFEIRNNINKSKVKWFTKILEIEDD